MTRVKPREIILPPKPGSKQKPFVTPPASTIQLPKSTRPKQSPLAKVNSTTQPTQVTQLQRPTDGKSDKKNKIGKGKKNKSQSDLVGGFLGMMEATFNMMA